MSNIFSKYKKELASVQVIDSSDAYVYNPKTGLKDIPNADFDFVGKVDTKMPNFVLKMNKQNNMTAFVEDVSELPKRVKVDLVKHFFNRQGKRNKKTVAYLVRTDKNSKTQNKEVSKNDSKQN